MRVGEGDGNKVNKVATDTTLSTACSLILLTLYHLRTEVEVCTWHPFLGTDCEPGPIQ